ncbi:dehydrogenase [Microbacterium paraoxydans]|uniref:dehydrogenase n=1 Tax=Microbacterium paraoxydans TaxID=199592 RepID=UPI001CF9C473|nr:dehydrogenase [Microbacterium paraoxydans]
MSETVDPTKAAAVDEALTSPLHLPHDAASCPKCFTELQQNRNFWTARPDGSRLVGLVVAREGMPSVVKQREDLTRFGVPIEGFRHPAPDILESWNDRLARLISTLRTGDVVVVANIKALGLDAEEGARTVAELRRHGIIVKVLNHDARHLADAASAR